MNIFQLYRMKLLSVILFVLHKNYILFHTFTG